MGKGKSETEEFCQLCGAATFYCVVFLVAFSLFGFGIAKIAVGATNINNCSIEKLIPVYLIISGLAPLLFSCLSCRGNGDIETCSQILCGTIGFLFSFAWLICGTVWIYPNYGKVMSENLEKCTGNVTTDCLTGDCDKSFLRFAVAMVTFDWILLCLWTGVIAFLVYRECKK